MRNFEIFYEHLLSYKNEHGDCLVPVRFVDQDGMKIGGIISRIRSDQIRLTEEQRAKLNEIGFVWHVYKDTKTFEEIYDLLLDYRAKYGHCLIPKDFVTEKGERLGVYACRLRWKNGIRITNDQKRLLDSIGFVWRQVHYKRSFDEIYELILKYKSIHGDCLIPATYVTEDGEKIGLAVMNLRARKSKLSLEEIKALDNIGFVWRIRERRKIDEVYKLLLEYKQEFGDCKVPHSYVTKEGIRLGIIVANLRGRQMKLSEEEMKILDSIGFFWRTKKQ